MAIGYVDGCATDSETIRDEFFHDTAHHNPHGRNLSVFGLAVIPELRGHGIGVTLLNQFIALAKSTGRESVILTCKEQLIQYYQSFGFLNLGISKSSHGGAQWFDMILRL
jgi:predicted GNAT family N-acyltransferase